MSSAALRLARQVKIAKELRDAHAAADRVLEQARKAKRVHEALPKPEGPGKSKAAARQARRMTLAEIRVALHAETGGMCPICGLGLPFVRMHAHHILSGPERRSEERQDTMAPLHERCHEWVHGRDAKLDQREALVCLLAWCERTKRFEATTSTVRRIAKLDEARAVVPGKAVGR